MAVSSAFKRLVVVSNRGPLTIKESAAGVTTSRSVSGLVSAVEPIIESTGGMWIAWCGRKEGNPGEGSTWPVPDKESRYIMREVMLSPKEERNYYHGFANGCLWPLSHSFVGRCVIDAEHWESYKEVNRRFADITAAEWQERDLVWVHDFHLTLVPMLLRRKRPQARIAFFWHIPFPSYDLFSIIPWAPEIIRGLLNCDSIAFHSEVYVENFLNCANRLLGIKVLEKNRLIQWEGRKISIRALPIGVDTDRFEALAKDPRVCQRAAAIRHTVGTKYLALSVDRLDYTKGVLERLRAIELFLEKYPKYRSNFSFLQIAVPTRTERKDYRELRAAVEEAVGRINGRFGEQWRVPVRYQFRALNQEYLVAHYLAADVAMVTPLRDGLNLVAKEYVASRVDNTGVLVLSPFAGTAEKFSEAVPANPYQLCNVAEQLRCALEMPIEEQKRRMKILRQNVLKYNLSHWWQATLEVLSEAYTREELFYQSRNIRLV